MEVDPDTTEKLNDLNITLDVRLMLAEDTVWIRMEGPKSKWFGVSFGAVAMQNDPYGEYSLFLLLLLC